MDGSERSGDEGIKSERRLFLERMAERLGAAAGVRSIYGEAVERDGVTVIPVAKVAWGFGGGDNAGAPRADGPTEIRSSGEGSGGGGGVTVSPVGYVEIAGGRTRFRRIWSPGQVALLVAVSAVAVALGARAAGGLVRRVGRGIRGSGAPGF